MRFFTSTIHPCLLCPTLLFNQKMQFSSHAVEKKVAPQGPDLGSVVITVIHLLFGEVPVSIKINHGKWRPLVLTSEEAVPLEVERRRRKSPVQTVAFPVGLFPQVFSSPQAFSTGCFVHSEHAPSTRSEIPALGWEVLPAAEQSQQPPGRRQTPGSSR